MRVLKTLSWSLGLLLASARIVVPPRMHRLHHARPASYHDRNFTFDLVIWDRLFGTYAACAPGTDPLTLPLGLEEKSVQCP